MLCTLVITISDDAAGPATFHLLPNDRISPEILSRLERLLVPVVDIVDGDGEDPKRELMELQDTLDDICLRASQYQTELPPDCLISRVITYYEYCSPPSSP